jgi:hypothetical protein
VRFVQEPEVQPWGTYATIEDSEGNTLLLVEQPLGKEELLRRIHRSRAALERLVRSLDEVQLKARGPSGWSTKDHLAHLATWELGIVELLHRRPRFAAMEVEEAVSQGLSEDEINELIYRRRAQRSLQDILDNFYRVHQEMLKVLEAMDDEALLAPYDAYLPEGQTGPQAPVLGWVAGNTYEHFDEHRRYIEALVQGM